MRKSAAIIGSGVSGMTAAYLLSSQFEVTAFEADSRLGGHVDTRYPEPGVAVDVAFMAFNPVYYPNFTRLLNVLGVAFQPTDLSTTVVCADCGYSCLSVALMDMGTPPHRPPRVSGHVWNRFLEDAERFGPRLQDVGPHDPYLTIEQFLLKDGFSNYFAQHVVYPMLCAWYLSDPTNIPIGLIATVLGLPSDALRGSDWCVVSEGSATYIERIAAGLPSVRTSLPVGAVSRTSDAVTVWDATGDSHRFDKAVIAVDPPQALAMLTDPTEEQRSVLGAFECPPMEVVLHSGASVLPDASGVVVTVSCANSSTPCIRTHFNINRLRGLSVSTSYWVSYSATDRLAAVNVPNELDRQVYIHPEFNPQFAMAQHRLPAISDNVLAFAGAYYGDRFHESGCTSGMAAAETLSGVAASRLLDQAPRGAPGAKYTMSGLAWLRPRGIGTSAASVQP